MGLDTTHDCWHGPYSAFHRWRIELAIAAGLPPLELMDGFFRRGELTDDPLALVSREWPNRCAATYRALPIRWESLKPSALYLLLHHSDCEGEIEAKDCAPIADELERLLPNLPQEDNHRERTRRFIAGLRLAAERGENVEFH